MGLFSGIFDSIKGVFRQSERDVKTVLQQSAAQLQQQIPAAVLQSVDASLTNKGDRGWGVIEVTDGVPSPAFTFRAGNLTFAEAYVASKGLDPTAGGKLRMLRIV